MGLFGRGKSGGMMNVIRCDEEEYLVWKSWDLSLAWINILWVCLEYALQFAGINLLENILG